ncbi:MAG: NDP-sugar synthase [Bacteroidia bacterium]
MKAMLLAAGFGTRMQPITLSRPKALVEVGKMTLLERNIRYLKAFGVDELVINVHHFAEQIIDFLKEHDNFGITIHISDETDAVLETGGGLKRAAPYLQGNAPFILMNVDILTDLDLAKMRNFHAEHNALATLAVTNRTSSRALLFDENFELKGWQNDNTGEKILTTEQNISLQKFAFSGVHILSPAIFEVIAQEGKFSIITTYLALAKQYAIYGFEHSESKLLDVGKPEAIEKAIHLFGGR